MKAVTPDEARKKIRRYCAYQERSHHEVRIKLYGFGLRGNDVEEILTDLITEGYLNEERFARLFAGGKFRMKKWGRVKITIALQAKGVSPNCIRMGLTEIDETSYVATLRALLDEKMQSLDSEDPFVVRDRLSTFAIRKGYEADLVWTEVRQIVPD